VELKKEVDFITGQRTYAGKTVKIEKNGIFGYVFNDE